MNKSYIFHIAFCVEWLLVVLYILYQLTMNWHHHERQERQIDRYELEIDELKRELAAMKKISIKMIREEMAIEVGKKK